MITPKIKEIIQQKAIEFEIDPNLVMAFVLKESSGHSNAIRYEADFYHRYTGPMNFSEDEEKGRATSYGLMQIMGEVARELGFKGEFKELFDPTLNLSYALKHLKRFINKYKTQGLDYAIASYNAGSPRFTEAGKGVKFVNQEYVDKIHLYLKTIYYGG
jgi:soluble lytic murein transglycosylase-like protein